LKHIPKIQIEQLGYADLNLPEKDDEYLSQSSIQENDF